MQSFYNIKHIYINYSSIIFLNLQIFPRKSENVCYMQYFFIVKCRFLLSSDIRSEGSIAIVKKLDLDFLFYITPTV